MAPKPKAKNPSSSVSSSKGSSDLWWTTLSILNILIFVLSAIAVYLKTESSTIKVPTRLVAGNEYIQGDWWAPLLNIALQLGLLGVFFFYSNKLTKLDPIYKNGILIMAICIQLIMFSVFFRVAGLTSLN